MSEYHFITQWHFEAPLAQVFDPIFFSLEWPRWWQGAENIVDERVGDSLGIGNVRRYTWKSRLPFQITFDACTTRIDMLRFLEATTTGDLEGIGSWNFSKHGKITTVHHEWHVRTTRMWMNFFAPIARPLFRKNHHQLMERGAEGLARHLGVRLVAVNHGRPTKGSISSQVASGGL